MAASALQRSVRTGSCCTNARYGDGVHAYKVSVDDTVHAHTERVLTIAPHLHFQNVQTGSKLRLEKVVDDLPSLRLIIKVPVSVPVSEWGARTSLPSLRLIVKVPVSVPVSEWGARTYVSVATSMFSCINVFSAHVHACCVGWKAASFTPARARYQRIVEATRTSSQKCMRSASYSAASKGRHS